MRIKEVMREKGITQRELAKRMKIAPSTLSRMLKGNTTLATIEKIANALGVPSIDLFDSQEQKTIHENAELIRKKAREFIEKSIEKTKEANTHTFICPCCGAELKFTITHDLTIPDD